MHRISLSFDRLVSELLPNLRQDNHPPPPASQSTVPLQHSAPVYSQSTVPLQNSTPLYSQPPTTAHLQNSAPVYPPPPPPAFQPLPNSNHYFQPVYSTDPFHITRPFHSDPTYVVSPRYSNPFTTDLSAQFKRQATIDPTATHQPPPPPAAEPPPPPPADDNYGFHDPGNYGTEHQLRYDRTRLNPHSIDFFMRAIRPYHILEDPTRWVCDVEREAKRLGIPFSLLNLHIGEFFRRSDCDSVKTWFRGINSVVSAMLKDGDPPEEVWEYIKSSLIDDFDNSVAVAKARTDLRTLKYKIHMDPQTFMTKVSSAIRMTHRNADTTSIIQATLERLPGDIGKLLAPATQYRNRHEFGTRFIACVDMIRLEQDQAPVPTTTASTTDQDSTAASQVFQVRQQNPAKNPAPARNTNSSNPTPSQVQCHYCLYTGHSAHDCRKLKGAYEYISNIAPTLSFNDVYNVLVNKVPHPSPAFKQFFDYQAKHAPNQYANNYSRNHNYNSGPYVTHPPQNPPPALPTSTDQTPTGNYLAIEAASPSTSTN